MVETHTHPKAKAFLSCHSCAYCQGAEGRRNEELAEAKFCRQGPPGATLGPLLPWRFAGEAVLED